MLSSALTLFGREVYINMELPLAYLCAVFSSAHALELFWNCKHEKGLQRRLMGFLVTDILETFHSGPEKIFWV